MRTTYYLALALAINYNICAENVTSLEILLTSGLNGRFDIKENGPARLEQLAITITDRQKLNPGLVYFDLGESLFPGALSRFSLGLAMADFFKATRVNGINIGAGDLQLGIDTLILLQKTQNIPLLSANITQKGKAVFQPFIDPLKKPGQPIFISLSDKNLPLRIVEKKGHHFASQAPVSAVASILKNLPADTTLILLSALSLEANLWLLASFKQIKLVISNRGSYENTRLRRVQLHDGRSVIMVGSGLGLTSVLFNPSTSSVESIKTISLSSEKKDTELGSRVSLWRKKFSQEDRHVLTWSQPKAAITENSVASYLRYIFDCEIAVLEKGSIKPNPLPNEIYQSDILQRVSDDFNIVTIKLTGDKILSLPSDYLAIDGIKDNRVQGYEIKPAERFRVCTTERVISQYLAAEVFNEKNMFESTWQSIPQILDQDLYKVLKRSFNPDHSVRHKFDFKLSGMIESSQVNQGDTIDTPPGKPSVSALRYRLESSLDYTVYNRYHHLVLTPYILIGRQIDQPKTGKKPTFAQTIRDNIMAYTLNYNYNPQWLLKPYHRSYLEAAVFKVNHQRPALIRETLGLRLPAKGFSLDTGLGFEKDIQDPVNEPVWGFEIILYFRYGLLKNLFYQLDLNVFASAEKLNTSQLKLRSEMTNALEFKMGESLSLVIKQFWFYFFQQSIKEKYDNFRIMSGLTYRLNLKP